MWRSVNITKINNALLRPKKQLKTSKSQHLTSKQIKFIQATQLSVLQTRFSSSTPKTPIESPNVAETGIESVSTTSQGILDSEPLIRLLDPSNYNSIVDPLIYSSEFVLDFIRIATGMPWVPSIITFALLTRLLSVPLVTKRYHLIWLRSYIRYLMQKHSNLQPHEFVKQNVKLLKELKVTPLYILRNYLGSMSLYMTGFVSVYLISKELTYPIIYNTLKESSFFWVNNLSLMDPYMILPGLSVISIFLTMGQTKNMKFNVALLGLCGALFYLTYGLPAAVHIYWAVLNLSNFLIRPYVRVASKVKAKITIDEFEKKYPDLVKSSNDEESSENEKTNEKNQDNDK